MVSQGASEIDILNVEVLGTVSAEYQPSQTPKARGAVTLYECQDVRVVKCRVHDNNATAIYVYGINCTKCLIHECNLSDNGPTVGSGISGREHSHLHVTKNLCNGFTQHR